MIEVECTRGSLVWRPAAPVRVASTSVLGGGVGDRAWFLNTTVDKDYAAADPAGDLDRLARSLGLAGEGVGMMTAKDVAEATTATAGGVDVVATVGLGWPVWAVEAEAGAEAGAGRSTPGTINLLVVVPVPLPDAALVNAVATVTEAKVQALLEAGVDGTGTASDAVCVAAPVGAPADRYGGPRSRWGGRIARAVHRAVLDGAAGR
jgi:adenosylcobinamide amidohydrolase